MLCSLLHKSLHLFTAQTTLVIRNGNLIGLSSALLSGTDIQNTIRIHVKGDFNLRHTTRHRRNAFQVELAQVIAVLGELTLTFIDLDEHTRLVVCIRTERLRCLLRDCSVSLDDRRHHTTSRFQTQRERSNIQKNHILHSLRTASENVCLHCSTIRNCLIRMHRVVELLAIEVRREQFANLRNTR